MKLADIISQNKVITLAQLLQDPELIGDIQRALAAKGLYPEKKIDDYWGALTQGALANFCDSEHLNNHKTGKFGATFATKLLDSILPDWHGGNKDETIGAIIKESRRQSLTNPQIAYVLATAKHETAGSFQPVEEGYYLGNRAASIHQKSLRYYPFYGK